MFDFEYHLKVLPDKPGVYIMKNALGEVIYVGKAKVLKNRVRQYFQSSRNHSEKVRAMVKNIAEFEYIVTDSEMEALILECNLIKKHRPRYNILLKDDKSYPFIKVTTTEDFPRVFVTRHVIKDGAKYFGPYTDVSAVYETLELIKKIFPIRTCKRVIKEDDKESVRPCLNYHIGLCKGPCAKIISREEYKSIISDITSLLSGKSAGILRDLEVEMEKSAESLQFEKAAAFRDKINAIKKVTEKQKIITSNFENEDFISLYKDEKDVCVQVFFLREGKIVGREHFIIENSADMEDKEIISDFIKSFYGAAAFIPKSIYVEDIDEQELLEQWLTMKRGSKVWIKVPQKGDKKDTLDMVRRNAKITLEQFKIKILQDKELYEVALRELSEILNLEDIPKRIEAYDISNIQGMDSVGSMVVFENGKSKNSDYRRFKINSVVGANDYGSMREIITRRFQHGLDEIKAISEKNLQVSSGKFCVFPDLILMDGGKGQVNIALEVLREFNIDIPVCGMVKDDKHNTRGLIYNNEELPIKKYSNIMRLITRIQDEVHRFAITYHRSLRNKTTFHSILDDIPGVGERRRKELLKKFGSVESIKKASYEEILETPSIDKKSAQNIVEFFKDNA
ncbi:excinuclease ABC subunit UvrC [Clostridium sp. HMP27]|uniref:excinuclease ABC subunit UvrC n=1 Tax=Clostridium sp. HMP27 TaxID=1487921 RepID=UPI00052D8A47|nr:excinuclease ABC subunit UvrC [Clostridium sp. HMP27]KGK87324.1 excinuclease ABC subunit C [Clostridium sp. HMP27]